MKEYIFPKDKVIILPVKLTGPHGEKWAQAILDTGATYSMFPPAVIEAVGLDLKKTTGRVKIITASSVEYVPFLHLPAIEVFGHTVENVQIVSHILPPGTPAQGLIGINLLQRFDFELLFSQSKLIVKKS